MRYDIPEEELIRLGKREITEFVKERVKVGDEMIIKNLKINKGEKKFFARVPVKVMQVTNDLVDFLLPEGYRRALIMFDVFKILNGGYVEGL